MHPQSSATHRQSAPGLQSWEEAALARLAATLCQQKEEQQAWRGSGPAHDRGDGQQQAEHTCAAEHRNEQRPRSAVQAGRRSAAQAGEQQAQTGRCLLLAPQRGLQPMHLAPYSELRGAQLCQQECEHQEQANGKVEARPCPEPSAPPGAWPGRLRALGAAPCRGPAAQSGPAAGAVPVSPASGGKLKHGAGVGRALPRPNATAPGCSERGAQELHQPSEQPCHWGGACH